VRKKLTKNEYVLKQHRQGEDAKRKKLERGVGKFRVGPFGRSVHYVSLNWTWVGKLRKQGNGAEKAD